MRAKWSSASDAHEAIWRWRNHDKHGDLDIKEHVFGSTLHQGTSSMLTSGASADPHHLLHVVGYITIYQDIRAFSSHQHVVAENVWQWREHGNKPSPFTWYLPNFKCVQTIFCCNYSHNQLVPYNHASLPPVLSTINCNTAVNQSSLEVHNHHQPAA